MRLLDIFSGGTSGVAKGAAEGIITGVGDVLDNLFTSDEERLAAKSRDKRIKQRPMEAQWEANKIEAAHRSVFVAGWRPAIGWVCAASLATYYIPQFMMGSVLWAIDCWNGGSVVAYPLSINGVTELVSGMLGMAGLRTLEKIKGKAK